MFWKFSGDAFWVTKRFCNSKTDWVTNFWLSSLENLFFETWFFWTTDFCQLIFLPTHLFGQLIFDNSLFCLTHCFTNWIFDNWYFVNWFFWQLIFFLTTNCFDSLSNYLTDQLGVWDSRPLVLFWHDLENQITVWFEFSRV